MHNITYKSITKQKGGFFVSENQNSSYHHVVDLMNAALPFINQKSKTTMEVFIKAGELMDSFSASSSPDLQACDISETPTDYEGLLLGLQEVSTPKESELINTLLNYFKAQKLYRTYSSVKDILPPKESGNFTRNQLFPMIEHFFESYQNNKERS